MSASFLKPAICAFMASQDQLKTFEQRNQATSVCSPHGASRVSLTRACTTWSFLADKDALAFRRSPINAFL